MKNTISKLDAIQLEKITQGMLKFVENDNVARFALETHLHNLNESKGSSAVAYFATKFFSSLEAA
jgi:hypothetical protein